jgi:hypothetical protein
MDAAGPESVGHSADRGGECSVAAGGGVCSGADAGRGDHGRCTAADFESRGCPGAPSQSKSGLLAAAKMGAAGTDDASQHASRDEGRRCVSTAARTCCSSTRLGRRRPTARTCAADGATGAQASGQSEQGVRAAARLDAASDCRCATAGAASCSNGSYCISPAACACSS